MHQKDWGMQRLAVWIAFVVCVVLMQGLGQRLKKASSNFSHSSTYDGNVKYDNVNGSIDIFYWDWHIDDNISHLKQFLREHESVGGEQHIVGDIQHIVVDKYDPNDYYNGERENATFLVLCRNDDVFELLQTLRLLQDRFNHRYNYDFTFLNDVPFTMDFIFLVSTFIPRGKLNFGSIPHEHWSYPAHIDQERALQTRLQLTNVPYGNSESYRHMCRYFSGFVHRHPIVQQYQYYWRVEPGVTFRCDLPYDLFKYMMTHDKKYAFAISLFEYHDTIPTLWRSFKLYIKTYFHDSSLPLLPLLQNDDAYESYNLCHFWTNFEVADLSIYNEQYDHFFAHLDLLGGFYYERWGDAPIHSMAIALFLNKSQIHWVNDLGYSHSPYSQCPQDTDLYVENKCTCDPDNDFSFDYLSCTAHFLKIIA